MTNLPDILRREFIDSPFCGLDSFFEDTLSAFFPQTKNTVAAFAKSTYPKINIKKTSDAFIVEATVPGLAKEDINIELEDGILSIAAEKIEEREEGVDILKREIHKSSFRRSFKIDTDIIKTDNITAEVENGMLVLTLPLKKEDKYKKNIKKIKIK